MSNGSPSVYSSILLPMDLDPSTEGRCKLAVGLADRFASRLIGVAAQPVQAPLYFEAPVTGIPTIIELEERRANEELAKAEANFRRCAGTRGRIEWRQALTFTTPYILEQARAADLIVAARPRRDDKAFAPMSADSGSLVMDAGRPVLFVPPKVDYLAAKCVVIGWKDSREARRAVWDSLPLLRESKEVLIVSVDPEEHGAKDVAAHLGCHGVQASTLHRPPSAAGIADDLVGIAQQQGADLIVCGAYGHSRAREWVLGGVTHDLLDHSPLCVLMSH
jgi:nucleotide-binding universal stress UspA family protein